MKKIFKFLIYIFYVAFSFFFSRKGPLQNKDSIRVGFFSVTKVEQAYTAGDSSILEFTKIFNATLNQDTDYNLSLSNLRKIKHHELNIMITRDIISFVVLDIMRLFRRYNFDLIYYATDIFSNRVDTQKRSLKQSIYIYSIDVLESLVWSRADFIFANRLDECEKISDINPAVYLVPAKSRLTVPMKLSFPDHAAGLKFIFVGASGNAPNRQSIETFLKEYWPTLINQYPLSSLKIIGRNWDKYITPPSRVILMGFLTDEELLTEYENADFSICYLDYGAGVKGKVLEAMENNTVALANAVAFEGIYCEALIPFESSTDLLAQVEGYLVPESYSNTVLRYNDFLKKNYSRELIEEKILSIVSVISKSRKAK
tara:strand:- start:14182 stop:15294 length:1113 start_codon:yes stop_codon:yes gene_type:complete